MSRKNLYVIGFCTVFFSTLILVAVLAVMGGGNG